MLRSSDHVEHLHSKLLKGKIDFYIYPHSAYDSITETEHLIAKPLLNLNPVAVVSANTEYLEDPIDITSLKWVMPKVNQYFSRHNFWDSYQKIKDKGNLVFEVDSNNTRLELAIEGVAATIVPLFTVREFLDKEVLKQLPIELDTLELSVYYLTTNPLHDRAKKILDYFVEVFNTHQHSI